MSIPSPKARWLALSFVLLAVAAASTAAVAHGIPPRGAGPRAPARPSPAASALPTPPVSPASAPDLERRTCAEAARVLRGVAEGRIPEGVFVSSSVSPSDETPAATAIRLARGGTPSPTCACQGTECTATIVYDVDHTMRLSFGIEAEDLRLSRLELLAFDCGGW